MGRTSGYDARIRPNFKGSKRTVAMVQPVGRDGMGWDGMGWEGHPPPPLLSLAQVWDNHARWINRKRLCVPGEPPVILSRRGCHLFPPWFVSCAVTLPSWPTALGYNICTQTFASDYIFLHQRWAVIITCHPCRLVTHERGQKIPSDTSPLLSWVTFHIYFRLTLHLCQTHAGQISADYLYIHTH